MGFFSHHKQKQFEMYVKALTWGCQFDFSSLKGKTRKDIEQEKLIYTSPMHYFKTLSKTLEEIVKHDLLEKKYPGIGKSIMSTEDLLYVGKEYEQPLIPKQSDKKHIEKLNKVFTSLLEFIKNKNLFFIVTKIVSTHSIHQIRGIYQLIIIKGKNNSPSFKKRMEYINNSADCSIEDGTFVEGHNFVTNIAITERHLINGTTMSPITIMLSLLDHIVPYYMTKSFKEWYKLTSSKTPHLHMIINDPSEQKTYSAAKIYEENLQQFLGEQSYKELLLMFDMDKFVDGYYCLHKIFKASINADAF